MDPGILFLFYRIVGIIADDKADIKHVDQLQQASSAMLDWLHRYARKQGCEQLHLDSGIQREQAHRFYHREGMTTAAYHFVTLLNS
jgi:hypothetical protein